ncbi:site-specific integrase [Streptomyces sp. NPDC057539]|uniref:site-specific integrase n=1 Tax=Streptomyces sp. NPDC057539 TaxID=3346159 RepID=UPI00369A976E
MAGDPLEWRPHDFRRIFVTDAIRSGLPPHIAAKICGHAALDTTMGYAAIYPEDVITHHRAFTPDAEPSGPAKSTASSPPPSGTSSWPTSNSARSP